MADYNSDYTGAEIDQGVGNGLAAPTTYAPIAHDSTATTYGKGTDTKYGHLKLSASTSSTSGTSGGIAATPSAVKAAYDLANGKQDPATTLAGYGITDAATSDELGTFVRPNLLDNWYFVGGGSQQGGGQFPINQKGSTTYSGSAGYGIDRWYRRNTGGTGNPTFTLNANGLAINFGSTNGQGINQPVGHKESLAGKTVTCSILISDVTKTGTIKFGLYTASTVGAYTTKLNEVEITGDGLYWFTATVPSNISSVTYLQFVPAFNSNSGTITATLKAAKMEIGDFQTLAHQENGAWVLNEIPSYNEQLMRCQEYDYWLKNTSASDKYGVMIGSVPSSATSYVNGAVFTPVPMRSKPTISHASCDVYRFNSSTRETIADDAVLTCSSYVGSVAVLQAQASSALTAGEVASLEILPDGYIHFDANL